MRYTPLANTRAYPRAVYWRRFAKRARAKPGARLSADWTYISLKDFDGETLEYYGPMNDPRDATVFLSGAAYAPPQPSPESSQDDGQSEFDTDIDQMDQSRAYAPDFLIRDIHNWIIVSGKIDEKLSEKSLFATKSLQDGHESI